MKIERYLIAFEKYRDTVLGMQRAMNRKNAMHRTRGFAGEMIDFVNYEELEKEYERKQKILGHATKRLQRAISEIKSPRLSDYLLCKYMYRMTNGEIADSFHYCERQVYRIAAQAKKQLERYLSENMPRAKKWDKKARFTFKYKKRHGNRRYGPWRV